MASLLDPINVASAFLPVVGQAKWAAIVGRLGLRGLTKRKLFLRGTRGALEGAVGAAIIEPVILTAARQEQADYDLTSSMVNIGIGGILGGGLHIGGGALRDALGLAPDFDFRNIDAEKKIRTNLDMIREAKKRGKGEIGCDGV